VQKLAMPHSTSNHETVTVSVGVACTRPGAGNRPAELIEAADAALYAAKHRGRNAVIEHGLGRLNGGEVALAG
jgi:diguanylate cyclase (GGDEF)-like protein